MPVSLQYFLDAALTAPITTPFNVQQADDGSTGPVDLNLFLGSVAVDKKFQAESNPGIDQITVSIADANPASGQEPDAIKLALTAIGLDAAVAGDPLALGTQLLSGVGPAKSIWVRVEDQTGVVATSLDLSLETNNVIELDV